MTADHTTASGIPLPAVAGPGLLAPGVEERLGRPAADGHRTTPEGHQPDTDKATSDDVASCCPQGPPPLGLRR